MKINKFQFITFYDSIPLEEYYVSFVTFGHPVYSMYPLVYEFWLSRFIAVEGRNRDVQKANKEKREKGGERD